MSKPVSRRRRVRVALWLCHMYSQDEDDARYKYPRTEADEFEANACADAAREMYEHAQRIAGYTIGAATWRSAIDSFGSAS